MALSGIRISLFLVMLSLIGCAHASSSPVENGSEGSSVVTLDHSNFTDFVAKQKFIVVEFYAPWCGACRGLAPEYEKAASILSQEDPPLILAKIDASDESNKHLGSEYEIRGYPTIKIFRYGGTTQDYKGNRNADSIVAYMKKHSGPASLEIKSTENVTSLVDSKNIVIVGIFPDFSGEKFENFTTLAERLRADDYEFGHTSDAKLLPLGDSSIAGPIVRLFKPFDELFVDFQEFDVNALKKLVEETSIPTVTLFDNDSSNHSLVTKFFNAPSDKAMLFINFTSEHINAFKSKYREVAEDYKEKGINFLIGDVEASQGAFEFFGLNTDQAPVIIIQTNEGHKYLKTNVEADQIAAWVKEYKDGHVQLYTKSEPIPETNDEPVKVVVADSLDDMVFKSGKNVLLEFYAPYCGHCKKLAPILDEVAVSFENDADMVIAKIDATANDFAQENFVVQGYPTLYFKSSGGNLVEYDGDRTKEDIIDFIQKNRDKTLQQESRKDEL